MLWKHHQVSFSIALRTRGLIMFSCLGVKEMGVENHYLDWYFVMFTIIFWRNSVPLQAAANFTILPN